MPSQIFKVEGDCVSGLKLKTIADFSLALNCRRGEFHGGGMPFLIFRRVIDTGNRDRIASAGGQFFFQHFLHDLVVQANELIIGAVFADE